MLSIPSSVNAIGNPTVRAAQARPEVRFGLGPWSKYKLEKESAGSDTISLQQTKPGKKTEVVDLPWKTVEPGVWVSPYEIDGFRGHVLKVAPGNQSWVRPMLAEGILGNCERLPAWSKRVGAMAAVNTTYFRTCKEEAERVPVATIKVDGEFITGSSRPRATLGITADNQFIIDRMTVRGTLDTDGRTLELDSMNQLPWRRNKYIDHGNYMANRGPWNETIAFNSHWGDLAPPMEEGMRQVQISDGKISAISDEVNLAIPENGYVIVGPKETLPDLQLGQSADIDFKASNPEWDDVPEMMSGRPMLIKDGVVQGDWDTEDFPPPDKTKNIYGPRTLVGITKAGELLLVVTDAYNYSYGPNFPQATELLKKLGAHTAFGYDGGTSVSLVVDGEYQGDPPSHIGQPRRIPTALGIFPPKDTQERMSGYFA